jgi:hypothetical protein
MRSQIVTASQQRLSQIVIASGSRNIKHLPFVFAEQGVAMLSSVLKSDRAIDVNIKIMRAFVILRQHLSDYAELSAQINSLEKQMNRKFKDIHEALNYLMGHSSTPQIGFRQTSSTTQS